jgi:hypothetical protein
MSVFYLSNSMRLQSLLLHINTDLSKARQYTLRFPFLFLLLQQHLKIHYFLPLQRKQSVPVTRCHAEILYIFLPQFVWTFSKGKENFGA